MTWRPISEAPKDGVELDLWVEFIAVDDNGVLARFGRRIADCWWDTLAARWMVGLRRVERGGHAIATHWMPLPAPPEGVP